MSPQFPTLLDSSTSDCHEKSLPVLILCRSYRVFERMQGVEVILDNLTCFGHLV